MKKHPVFLSNLTMCTLSVKFSHTHPEVLSIGAWGDFYGKGCKMHGAASMNFLTSLFFFHFEC